MLTSHLRASPLSEKFAVHVPAGLRAPLLSPRNSGAQDAIEDATTGLLVSPGNVADVITTMRLLLTDASLCHRFGDNARRLAASWTWDHVASEYEKTY